MRGFVVLALALSSTIAEAQEFRREGWELSLMLGAAGGTSDPVIHLAGATLEPKLGTGFAFGGRFAYRPIPWVGPYFDAGLGIPSGGRVFAGGIGVAGYPLHFGRIDPFVDIGASYVQWRSASYDATIMNIDYNATTTLHGGALHVGIGAPIFLLPWLSAGPSFRYEHPFWHSECSNFSGFGNCQNIGTLAQSDPDFKGTLPKLWRAGIDVVFHPSRRH
jgi:hypothetical protein